MQDAKRLAYKLLSSAIDLTILILQADGSEESRAECSHPEQCRLDLTVMGGPKRWYCRECGFQYIEEEVAKT